VNNRCVDVRRTAHRGGHGGEAEGFVGRQLPEDVDHVVVLGAHRVLLQLLHVLPVLQRQTDLRPEKTHTHNENMTSEVSSGRAVLRPEAERRVSDLLRRRAELAAVQAVQQVKSSHSDLEAVRRHEEAVGRVQGQAAEVSPLFLVNAAAAKTTTTCDTLCLMRKTSNQNQNQNLFLTFLF